MIGGQSPAKEGLLADSVWDKRVENGASHTDWTCAEERGRCAMKARLASSDCRVPPSVKKHYRAHKAPLATALDRYFDLGPVALGGDIGAVKNGDGLAGEGGV